MKKLLLSTIAVFALAVCSPAMGTDQSAPPVRDYPIYVPAFNWQGFYVGVQGGYLWAHDSDHERYAYTGEPSPYTPAHKASPDGAKIGGYLGYNWQAAQWVFGLEADGELTDAKDSTPFSNTGSPPDFYRTTIRSQGALRARIGYAFDRALLYGAGGVAYADIKEHDERGDTGEYSSISTTRSGWTLGAGLDLALTNNWIGRAEYRYCDFGRFSYTPYVFPDFTERHCITENAVSFGLAYRF